MYGGPKRGLAIVWLALTQTGIWVYLMKHMHDSNRWLSRHRLLGVPHQIKFMAKSHCRTASPLCRDAGLHHF